MKIVVPCVPRLPEWRGVEEMLHPGVFAAIAEAWQTIPDGQRPQIDIYNLADDPDYGYGKLLARHWADGDTFCVVEHDVIVHPTVFDEFDACSEPYCAFPYPLGPYVAPALGCTRFRAELLAELPDVMERVLKVPTNYGDPGHWRQLDTVLMRTVLLNRYGRQPHIHLPAVEHANPEKQCAPGAPLRLEVPAWPALPEPA